MSPTRFTDTQGQYLAFIDACTRVHGRPPAKSDMQRHFRVSPPSVHQMVLTLERLGLIRRQPGAARSIEVLLAPEDLPVLRHPQPVSRGTRRRGGPVLRSYRRRPPGDAAHLRQTHYLISRTGCSPPTCEAWNKLIDLISAGLGQPLDRRLLGRAHLSRPALASTSRSPWRPSSGSLL